MRAIYTPLPSEEIRLALLQLAEREWRDPRDQATKLLVEGLRIAGVLRDEGAATELNPADNCPAVPAGVMKSARCRTGRSS